MLLAILKITLILDSSTPNFMSLTINFAIYEIPSEGLVLIFEKVSALSMKQPIRKLPLIVTSITELIPALTLLFSIDKRADVL